MNTFTPDTVLDTPISAEYVEMVVGCDVGPQAARAFQDSLLVQRKYLKNLLPRSGPRDEGDEGQRYTARDAADTTTLRAVSLSTDLPYREDKAQKLANAAVFVATEGIKIDTAMEDAIEETYRAVQGILLQR